MLGDVTIIQLGVVFGSILIAMSTHEAMHAFTAHWLGDDTAHQAGRLTLNPLKHIDFLTTVLLPVILIALQLPPFFVAKPVPFNPWRVRYHEFGAALIGLAGPLTNLVLACVAALGLRLSSLDPSTAFYGVMMIFIFVNVALFVFNMIPFPPLDGSRVLYALVPESIQKLMQRVESMGLGAIFVFMFLLFPFLSPLVITVNRFILNILI